MKYIKLLAVIFIISSCSNKNDIVANWNPEYKLINKFSDRFCKETGAILYSYGSNIEQTEEHIRKYGKRTFSITFLVKKNQDEVVSLDEARALLVSTAESLLSEINTDPEVRPDLPVYPLTYDWIVLYIDFVDENKIDIGNGGISNIYFREGKIKYETYAISQYNGKNPAIGKHSQVHKETYPEALEIVQRQGTLKHYSCLNQH